MSDIAKRSTIYLCMRKSATKGWIHYSSLLVAIVASAPVEAVLIMILPNGKSPRNGWGIGLLTFKRNYANTHFDLP